MHVAIGQRLGWPVSLASAGSHTVCRFDDGQVVYNLEATRTGEGGFVAGTDAQYAERFNLPPRAIAQGMDLHPMTARQMLAHFIMLRGRHYSDTDRHDLADRDYALARSVLPNNRVLLMSAMDASVRRSLQVFEPGERGHPIELANWLNAQLQPRHEASAWMDQHLAEVARINAMNRRNQERMMHPTMPGAHDPYGAGHVPGVPGTGAGWPHHVAPQPGMVPGAGMPAHADPFQPHHTGHAGY